MTPVGSGTSTSTPPPPSVEVVNIGTSVCRLAAERLGGAWLDGLPALRPAAVVVLRPGDLVPLLTEAAVPARPGQLRVDGTWVHVRPGGAP